MPDPKVMDDVKAPDTKATDDDVKNKYTAPGVGAPTPNVPIKFGGPRAPGVPEFDWTFGVHDLNAPAREWHKYVNPDLTSGLKAYVERYDKVMYRPLTHSDMMQAPLHKTHTWRAPPTTPVLVEESPNFWGHKRARYSASSKSK